MPPHKSQVVAPGLTLRGASGGAPAFASGAGAGTGRRAAASGVCGISGVLPLGRDTTKRRATAAASESVQVPPRPTLGRRAMAAASAWAGEVGQPCGFGPRIEAEARQRREHGELGARGVVAEPGMEEVVVGGAAEGIF